MTNKQTQLSKEADLLFEKVFWDHLKPVQEIFGQAVSEDLMLFFLNIAKSELDGFISRFPELKDKLTVNELESFERFLYETVGVGYRIFYAEKVYLKNDNLFSKHTGKKYMTYLLTQFNDYFEKNTKNPDVLIPSYVFEVIKQTAFMLSNEGVFKQEYAKKLSKECFEAVLIQPIHLISMGYVLSALSEKY